MRSAAGASDQWLVAKRSLSGPSAACSSASTRPAACELHAHEEQAGAGVVELLRLGDVGALGGERLSNAPSPDRGSVPLELVVSGHAQTVAPLRDGSLLVTNAFEGEVAVVGSGYRHA